MNSAGPPRPMIAAPWGPAGTLEVAFPTVGPLARAHIDVVWPDLSLLVGEYRAALSQALESPLVMAPLEQFVRPGSRIAIVVDDPSRWTPVQEALELVLPSLHAAGVSRDVVSIVMGVGRHHAVDSAGMKKRLGAAIAAGYRCLSPPVDDLSAYADLGQTPRGVPVRVFRPVVEADLRILVGSVLPHLQAGFGGGYKLIFPGASHRTTLSALHGQGLGPGSDAERLLGSSAETNPMRQAIHEAALRLGPCFSISHLLGGPGEILRVAAGHPAAVQDALATEAARRFQALPADGADMIVVGNHPWPGDPLQSFKVLLHHRAACRPGGILTGLFWTDPAELDRSAPRAAIKSIAVTGALGGLAIRQLLPLAERAARATGARAAFMVRWARELVVDREVLVLAPPLCERLGPRLGPVRLFSDQQALWSTAERLLERRADREPLRIRVFPQGGLTYARGNVG